MSDVMHPEVVDRLLARGEYTVCTPKKADEQAAWKVRCPVHDDRVPSLSVTLKHDGTVLLFCHGCTRSVGQKEFVKRLLGTLGCPAARLGPTRPGSPPPTGATLAQARARLHRDARLLDALHEHEGFAIAALSALSVGVTGKGNLLIPELDAAGAVVGATEWVQRDMRHRSGYKAKSRGKRGLVYDPGEAGHLGIWVEGPSTAIAAKSLGLPAVGLPNAGAWDTRWSALASGEVIVIADSDKPGRDHARRVAHALVKSGREVRVIDLFPGRDSGSDLADLLRQEGADRTLAVLAQAIADAPTMARRNPGCPPRRRDAAVEFIEAHLEPAGTPVSWSKLMARGRQDGHTAQTMRNARDLLRDRAAIFHHRIDGRHYWTLGCEVLAAPPHEEHGPTEHAPPGVAYTTDSTDMRAVS